MKKINAEMKVVLGAVMLSLLSACGGSANGADSTGATKEGVSAADQPAELVFHNLSGGAEEQFNLTYGNLIRQKFPNYTIKFIQSKPGATLPELVALKERVDI
ncbi:MAG: hypothetical protein K0R28_3019, partial [Paenibacillus sp.]|nr:hypothetical protein [Paenibacillus sp.]